jgi:hypothetical protein
MENLTTHIGSLTSLHLLDVRQLPSLVIKRLFRQVVEEAGPVRDILVSPILFKLNLRDEPH